MDIEQALSEAESYIHQNQTVSARIILGEILREDPQNEEAWILSAQVSDTPGQVRYCLQKALAFNPSSRARLLLDRLQKPQTLLSSIPSSQPAPQPLPDTQPPRDLPPSAAVVAEPAPALADTGVRVTQAAPAPVTLLSELGAERQRPTRWLPRGFTIAATACLAAPWLLMQASGNVAAPLSGVQVLQTTVLSSLGPDVVAAGLAALALPLLMFFRFKSAAAQKWGERATLALVPLAALPSLDLISSFYAGPTGILALRWGVWLACAFYSLTGLAALVNTLRLGKLARTELSAARAGRLFTWLFSLGDLLAFLWTVLVLVSMGKFSVIGIALPAIWLLLGALLSLFA